jgi:hypothetical protein
MCDDNLASAQFSDIFRGGISEAYRRAGIYGGLRFANPPYGVAR